MSERVQNRRDRPGVPGPRRQRDVTLSPDNVDTIWQCRRRRRLRHTQLAAGPDRTGGGTRPMRHGGWAPAALRRLNVDVRRYQRLAVGTVLVATSLLTLQSGGPDVVPSYTDFSLGGSNTVRGWGFNARRGKNQFINSLEYRYTVLDTRAFKRLRRRSLCRAGAGGLRRCRHRLEPVRRLFAGRHRRGRHRPATVPAVCQHDPARLRPGRWQRTRASRHQRKVGRAAKPRAIT